MIGKILSLLITIVYIILSYMFIGAEWAFRLAVCLLLPLACIWFSEEMGGYTGFAGIMRPHITETSHGFAVYFMGWFLLLLPAIIFLSIL